ncbi:MAG TPA: sigma-70 family RNA polymerase sigma factor [Steroidobacteraceae bacterium]|jgi:RNA polymerase sigma-70 factor (ECF subfamily)|nr:sigma-70 family RNA polymerase sigma factor [Steroidobacteraceae bacterium]
MQSADARVASDDKDVLELLRAGQLERAFALLLPRYEQKIYRLCHALLRDRTQAEDAAQESLVRIWRALHRYDGRAALSTWIYAITRNRCLTALGRRQRTVGASVDTFVSGTDLAQLPADPATCDPGGLSGRQRDVQLRSLVEALPERLRRVLVLYYFEERSVDEVARMLGCPEGTVKTHLFRARAALAERLRGLGLDDPRAWLEAGT